MGGNDDCATRDHYPPRNFAAIAGETLPDTHVNTWYRRSTPTPGGCQRKDGYAEGGTDERPNQKNSRKIGSDLHGKSCVAGAGAGAELGTAGNELELGN